MRVRLVAVAELRDEVAMLAAFRPIVEVPGEIPGRPPLIEAGEQPFLQAVAPFQVLDLCALCASPTSRSTTARRETACRAP